MDQRSVRRKTLDPRTPFAFSQSGLQDFHDCRRRFQLRYLEQLAWPAPQAEPVQENESLIRRGERFHRLAQQALLGVPPENLAESAAAAPDPDLLRWWEAFAALLPELTGSVRRVEYSLSAPLGSHRLVAKYDLLLWLPDEGRAVIYDWKTSLAQPKRSRLEERLQTHVYPYLLVQAGAALAGRILRPEQVEMVYWYAEFPDQPIRFEYDEAHYHRDQRSLAALAKEIEALQENQFERTEDEHKCSYCVYRSLCERGVTAGPLDKMEEEASASELEINFDQIGEIGF